jgi:hypothetical protein
MHTLNCNCPSCRAAAQRFEFETFESGSLQEVLSEREEMELAMELLNVQTEPELEQFLGNMFRKIGSGLKAVGSFAAKNVVPVLGSALKQIAKRALPIAGGALGSLIPIPGVGTVLGRAVGSVVANALEMEVAGLPREDGDIERARRFVRLAASAIREAASSPGLDLPENIARKALSNATIRHLPAAAGVLAAMTPTAGEVQSILAPNSMPSGHSGIWKRHGRRIVVEGL